MLKKRIPLPFALLMTFFGIILSGLLAFSYQKNTYTEPVVDNTLQTCPPDIKRLSGYLYIRPLLFADRNCESQRLMPLKAEVENIINNYKQSGTISGASVYLRLMSQAEYISMGVTEKYNPGSLLKVPELITFFKMREKNPGLLEEKISFNSPLNLPKQVTFVSKSIEVGKTYTIRELLYYMIAYSDNNATWLLNRRMDMDVFKKVFTDLGIANPDMNSSDIPITAKEYSYFMRVLYNASYLNIKDSEFCTELLSHSDFVAGLVNGLPKGTKVVHKFGEAGDGVNAHLSESGIVYLNNSAYLLTVMTKGRDNKSLPLVISDISRKIFENLSTYN